MKKLALFLSLISPMAFAQESGIVTLYNNTSDCLYINSMVCKPTHIPNFGPICNLKQFNLNRHNYYYYKLNDDEGVLITEALNPKTGNGSDFAYQCKAELKKDYAARIDINYKTADQKGLKCNVTYNQ